MLGLPVAGHSVDLDAGGKMRAEACVWGPTDRPDPIRMDHRDPIDPAYLEDLIEAARDLALVGAIPDPIWAHWNNPAVRELYMASLPPDDAARLRQSYGPA